MKRRTGLRAKMAVSYVLVTAAAVALVEAVGVLLVVPKMLADPPGDPTLIVQLTARNYAAEVTAASARRGRLPPVDELTLGDSSLQLAPGEAQASAAGASVRIPYPTTVQDEREPMSLALLLDLSGQIVASSYPARHPVGT